MSAHGPIFGENAITPADHAFDPTSKEDAKLLIDGFKGLQQSKGINVTQASFFLDKPFLNRLLTESRDGRREGQGISPDWFDGLTVYFGLDGANKIVLLMERAIFDNKSKRMLRYKKVPQTIPVRWQNTNTYAYIDYAIMPVNKEGASELKLIDTNSETYAKLRARFKEKFKNSPSSISVKQPGDELPVRHSTFIAGYFLGKNALRKEVWEKEGEGVGIKIFLGYGNSHRKATRFKNMQLIVIGAANNDATIEDYPFKTVWSTQRGYQEEDISLIFYAIDQIDGGDAIPNIEPVDIPYLTSSCVTPVEN
ncbi:hypothetical protein [Spirosoma sp.]|uniref:hypothetical protein n=1 Tax=Spirosoma sp. TaxID=1899569 RepID=UPI003B3A33EA